MYSKIELNMSSEEDKEWFEQQRSIDAILKLGMSEFADHIPDIETAFEESEHVLCCMDEGTPMGDIRSAGSGILTEGKEREKFLSALREDGVKSVTSHEGCGAAALYREQHGITDKTVDEVAIEQAQYVADELGVKYSGHITELKRPSAFHFARIVYVDGTGKFNPSRVKNLPPGFVVSRRYMSPEQALDEVRLASQIAFGHHGFGKRFTKESPLIIVAIGDKSEAGFSSDQLNSELTKLKEQLEQTEPENVARIKIDQWEPLLVEDLIEKAA